MIPFQEHGHGRAHVFHFKTRVIVLRQTTLRAVGFIVTCFKF